MSVLSTRRSTARSTGRSTVRSTDVFNYVLTENIKLSFNFCFLFFYTSRPDGRLTWYTSVDRAVDRRYRWDKSGSQR